MRSAQSKYVKKDQRGQAAVLTALSLFTMVVFLAMATNAGILVNDRIRMQNTADLTAYAGAFEQARTMNEMALLNKRIYIHVQRLRGILNYGPMYVTEDPPDSTDVFYWHQKPCSCLDVSPAAEVYIKIAQATIDAQYQLVRMANVKGQVLSRAAATNTASKNFLGLHLGPRHLSFFHFNPNSPTAPLGLVELERVPNTMVGYNFIRNCRCCDGCCPYPQIKTHELETWAYKGDDDLVYFPAKVQGVPLKNFLDIGRRNQRLFGADADKHPMASDMLYGYAAAKPFEGIIGTSNPDNDNISIDGGDANTPMNPIYPPSDDLENFFMATYRARMAGIHENMGGSGYSSMADLIADDPREPQFQDKVQYFAH